MSKNIIFTGGSGKAGRHVVQALVEHGYTVLNLDRKPLDNPKVRTLITDITDGGQVSTTRLAATLADKGITLIDAPLSQTPKDAWEGTLDVMVAGEPAVVARGGPILDAFAGRVIPTGRSGPGTR